MSASSEALEAARAARLRILSGGIQSYQTVLSGQVVYLDLTKLNALIAALEGEVAIEALAGEGGGSRIEVGLSSIDTAR